MCSSDLFPSHDILNTHIWEDKMNECIELYRVWVAFGVGLFIGGVVGVVAMCILNMARD